MSELLWISGLILVVFIAVLVLLGFKRMFKVLALLVLLFIIIVGVGAFVIGSDLIEVKTYMDHGKKVFIYNDGGFLLGVDPDELGSENVEDKLEGIFDAEKLSKLEKIYRNKRDSTVAGQRYLMIIMHRSFLEENLPENIELELFNSEMGGMGNMIELKVEYSKDFILDLLKSDECMDLLMKENFGDNIPMMARGVIKSIVPSCETLRPGIFMMAMQSMAEDEDAYVDLILSNIESGRVSLYPEFMTFKLLKMLPLVDLKNFIVEQGDQRA